MLYDFIEKRMSLISDNNNIKSNCRGKMGIFNFKKCILMAHGKAHPGVSLDIDYQHNGKNLVAASIMTSNHESKKLDFEVVRMNNSFELVTGLQPVSSIETLNVKH